MAPFFVGKFQIQRRRMIFGKLRRYPEEKVRAFWCGWRPTVVSMSKCAPRARPGTRRFRRPSRWTRCRRTESRHMVKKLWTSFSGIKIMRRIKWCRALGYGTEQLLNLLRATGRLQRGVVPLVGNGCLSRGESRFLWSIKENKISNFSVKSFWMDYPKFLFPG